ncbi:MAG: tRNA (adenosine(37)-N6)-threonylcarbamoyltransferase complex transferase subunit TsaD [Clostridiales bacterium]|nr:tRNA (adenosine(37)-N6)-threonylcarbamoyltransferase complex transferase subunit TsaD [Clostridiales bacterium]MDD7347128.1 tRNA (adenosine(37)-N6)-threonylcarbamoyltransferase complex transferase subunit TsaD [Clostridiales bacterium]MDY4060814.1 tRNA (adenosine(37)-N6)-threonylcarbamoyltransferase complex transferase subunit TsaD [Anaerovoracaceae bacterium]
MTTKTERKRDKNFITMAIETSCDETSAAILRGDREIMSNVISSQIDIHRAYGGVVPEIASRHHLENINGVVETAMEEAGVSWEDINLIGVTYGPGLSGALVIGVAAAKAYSVAKGIPLIGVNHMHGHMAAAYGAYSNLEPPFISLVVSGGHTNIVKVKSYTEFEVLGATRDDAIGEAYDKVARVLGLGYPGGPKIDKLAKEGDGTAVEFKRTWLEKGTYDFSFSGIKTGVLNYVNTENQAGREVNKADVAASFQEAVVEVVSTKTMEAVRKEGMDTLVLAGGVAANSRLSQVMKTICERENVKLCIPPAIMCTDNAGMVAIAAHYEFMERGGDGLDLDAVSGLDI